MFTTCLEKQNLIAKIFAACPTEDAKYQKIIDFGKQLPSFDVNYKTEDCIVKGCQSTMYLQSLYCEGRVRFNAASDALISAGLAAILIAIYNDESPETILKCPPSVLETLGISASLSPSRANGLYSIHLKMKQDALRLLLKHGNSK